MEQDYLKTLLDYNPETGRFTWRVSRKGSSGKNKEAGTLTSKGYRDVCIDGKKYGMHRLAFIWMLGAAPKCVDHINGIKHDNRWCNLREASYSQNGYNYKGTGSSTGFRNVYYDPRGNKKFMVVLVINGKRTSFGYYHTVEEAYAVATEMRNKYYGEFAHHG